MQSLPELSRETGIPMPLILRLANQHPNVIPSIGSGSQRSFPHGVVPALLALYHDMGTSGRTDHRHAALFTIGRRMRERRVAAEAEAEDASKRLAPSLALRLGELEGRQRKISTLATHRTNAAWKAGRLGRSWLLRYLLSGWALQGALLAFRMFLWQRRQ